MVEQGKAHVLRAGSRPTHLQQYWRVMRTLWDIRVRVSPSSLLFFPSQIVWTCIQSTVTRTEYLLSIEDLDNLALAPHGEPRTVTWAGRKYRRSSSTSTKKWTYWTRKWHIYIDTGEASNDTAVFLHGNPTSSYLWRNIIPYVASKARCIAPDLVAMGCSRKPSITYRFTDHARYLYGFLDAIVPEGNVVLVIHDWSSALGLDWPVRHQDRVSGIVLMEFITPLHWDVFPKQARAAFKAFWSPQTGRKMLIEENAFIESILPSSVMRKLDDAEMNHYREPFKSAASREPPCIGGPTSCPSREHRQMSSKLSKNTMSGSWTARFPGCSSGHLQAGSSQRRPLNGTRVG